MFRRALGVWAACALLTLNARPIAAATSTPYTGTPVAIPGIIEAENFDNGGEGVAYHDTTVGNSLGAYRQTDVDIQAATEGGYNVGKIKAGEWLNYSVNVSSAGKYVLDARVASLGQGGTFHVEFNGADVTGPLGIPDTGGWQIWTTVSTTVALSAGPQIMRVVFDAVGPNGAVGNLNWVRLSSVTSTPFTGTAAAVPGTIEAEDFDNGGEGLAYHDTTVGNSLGAYRQTDVDIEAATEGRYDVGKIKAGEWLNYSVNVSATGQYALDARVASSGQGGTFHIEFGGKDVTGPLTIPNTGGWQTWTTISTPVALPAGPQIMRVVFDAAGPTGVFGNLNWVRLSIAGSTPFTGTPATVPGTLRAENFDNGGEGLAYHDTTAGNTGGQYRNTDVDIEVSSLGGYDVGWTAAGEWLAYSVNVTTAGSYTLQFRVASKAGGGQFHASFGPTNTAIVAVPTTGGWQNWTTVSTTANLTAGAQVMKLVVDAAGFNVADMTLTATQALPPPPAVPNSPSVADGASGVTTTPTLGWQASGATSYDLRLGTTNPPPAYVSNITTSNYAPSPLTASTTYYWQVVAKNASGSATGPVWSFTIAAAPPPPPSSGVPTSYNAITDRTARPKPALPALGPAGFTFTDPTFGSKMMRVTDANTLASSPNISFRSPSIGSEVGWNADSTRFYVMSSYGNSIPYAFDAGKMTASRIAGPGDGGLVLAFNNEPEFDAANPNIIYGVGNPAHTIQQYDFSSSTYSAVINLDTISTFTGYVGGQKNGADKMMTWFGGATQDLHNLALWFPLANQSARKLLDTLASTINGVPTNITLNFHLHSAAIDKSGRYVLLYTSGADLAAPRYASPFYVWDTATDLVTAVTSGGNDGAPAALPLGHAVQGYGYLVNTDCCTTSTWDAAQWQIRALSNPLSHADLIAPVATPQEVYAADHQSWHNAQPGQLVPFVDGFYRTPTDTAPWRAWDDEIVAVETAAAPAAGATVWRFAHTRSNIVNDTNPSALWFWYTPRPNVSPNGRFVIFTSNWEKTLGTDPVDKTYREDVFLVQLQ